MADFDDLKLNKASVDAAPPPPRLPRWVILLAAAALLVALAALWYYGRSEPEGAPAAASGSGAQPRPPQRGPAEPGEDIDLPPLAETDPLVRELIGRLSSHPRVMAYLTTDHLVRNMTAVTVNVAHGQSPAPHLGTVRPEGGFVADRGAGTMTVSPATWARYDSHADAIGALDARGVARFYATISPRIDEAYADLGSPHGTFDRTLERAIVHLLQTPVPPADVRLKQDSVAYTYEDPALESLSQAQKQFMRMGPRNMRIVKAKLREIAGHLGIPEESLPGGR